MNAAEAIVTAFSVGATAIAKGNETAALQDAYGLLKRNITGFGIDADAFEQTPNSALVKMSLSEQLEAASGGSISELKELIDISRHLLEILQSLASIQRMSGIDTEELIAANEAILDVASVGTGVRIHNFSAGGNIRFGNMNVGIEPVDPWPQPGKPRK